MPDQVDPPTPRRHGRRRAQVAVALSLFAAGILATTSAQASHGNQLRPGAVDLPALVRTRQAQVAKQDAQVNSLERQVKQLTDANADAETRASTARAAALQGVAQFTVVTGAAVVVTLDDAPADHRRRPGVQPNDLVVHQQDVQGVINALWNGGAIGISLMGQRLASTTAVRCVGATLHLQGRVYSPPFRIVAVGDPARLQASLNADPQVSIYREFAKLDGLGYQVSTQARVQLPAATASTQLTQAKPVNR